MRPDCLVLDEATAMLDPHGRSQVMRTIHQLREAGISIVSITHYMEEAAQADRVLVMSRGRIVMEGTPEEVFSQTQTAAQLPPGCTPGGGTAGRVGKNRYSNAGKCHHPRPLRRGTV